MAKKERVRLNLDFPPSIIDNLETMVERSHAASRTEAVRRALKLFDMVLEHQEKGGKLVLQHEDGTQETIQIL